MKNCFDFFNTSGYMFQRMCSILCKDNLKEYLLELQSRWFDLSLVSQKLFQLFSDVSFLAESLHDKINFSINLHLLLRNCRLFIIRFHVFIIPLVLAFSKLKSWFENALIRHELMEFFIKFFSNLFMVAILTAETQIEIQNLSEFWLINGFECGWEFCEEIVVCKIFFLLTVKKNLELHQILQTMSLSRCIKVILVTILNNWIIEFVEELLSSGKQILNDKVCKLSVENDWFWRALWLQAVMTLVVMHIDHVSQHCFNHLIMKLSRQFSTSIQLHQILISQLVVFLECENCIAAQLV